MAVLGSNTTVAQAFSRFGLGGRPDDPLPSDPVGWLLDQLSAPDPTPVTGLPTTASGLAILQQVGSTTIGTAAHTAACQQSNSLFAQEVQAIQANGVLTTAPFRERLVQFWANHFAIMASTETVQPVAGAFVREAIRPHVTGTFTDMLLAVMQHPAMLYSLDNQASIAPQSQQAQAMLKITNGAVQDGINENLGRETLELYTVGIGANYAQADVDAMAYLLTGFTVNLNNPPYGFIYQPRFTQPGNQTLLGVTYPDSQAGALAALTALSTSPFTYQHLATKLVTHFVSDSPAAADIATIAQVLSSTGGNLAAAAQAVVALPSAWQPLTKLRTPLDLVIAALRAANVTAPTMPTLDLYTSGLGQPMFRPPFPNGWSDLAADWSGASQMLLRADCMNTLTTAMTATSPTTAAAASVAPFLSANTVSVIGKAASAHDQLTLLFCSPEFQRR